MQKIEHIGIVVNNIDEANNIFEKIIGKKIISKSLLVLKMFQLLFLN